MALACTLGNTAPRTTFGGIASYLARGLWYKLQPPVAPNPGLMPAELRVSKRAWRRNSAMLMSLYDDRLASLCEPRLVSRHEERGTK